MSDPQTGASFTQMATEIFRLAKLSWQRQPASRRQRENELTETQFLTLDMLTRGDPRNVGELQRAMQVVPAQMSRLIRSLENDFEAPLIRCELNPDDKRKIDVRLTETGRKVHAQFIQERIARTVELLRHLSEEDRQDFIRVCGRMRSIYERDESAGHGPPEQRA
ncbi:MAG: MarR family transcriptional regulator [Planctomycetes bacterium]|jgi:DNA-binding MarR family transcriptional regulator|nr:MarR family transcriptional regulator [Planctomycetota bacterium]MDA8378126.1 MarR family transcriptional regulator [Planctomycetia bacterium]